MTGLQILYTEIKSPKEFISFDFIFKLLIISRISPRFIIFSVFLTSSSSCCLLLPGCYHSFLNGLSASIPAHLLSLSNIATGMIFFFNHKPEHIIPLLNNYHYYPISLRVKIVSVFYLYFLLSLISSVAFMLFLKQLALCAHQFSGQLLPGMLPPDIFPNNSYDFSGNPLQYYCLENPMDRGSWQATVHGFAKSWASLSE